MNHFNIFLVIICSFVAGLFMTADINRRANSRLATSIPRAIPVATIVTPAEEAEIQAKALAKARVQISKPKPKSGKGENAIKAYDAVVKAKEVPKPQATPAKGVRAISEVSADIVGFYNGAAMRNSAPNDANTRARVEWAIKHSPRPILRDGVTIEDVVPAIYTRGEFLGVVYDIGESRKK